MSTTDLGAAPPTDLPSQFVSPRWIGRAHGLALLVFLLRLHLEKAGRIDGIPWISTFLGLWMEVGFVLFLESCLVMLAPSSGRSSNRSRRQWRLWQAGFLATHVAVYGGALLEHTFFVHTGTRLHLDLVRYGLGNLKMLSGLLSTGLDQRFVLHLLLAVVCLGIAIWVGRRPVVLPRTPRRTGALAVAGAACLALPMVAGSVASGPPPMTTNAFLDWSIAALSRGSSRAVSLAELTPSNELYLEPTKLSKPARRPSIVLVVLESTRADQVAPYGKNAERLTPRMADIASQSLVVEDAYATVTHTSKALVGILCGMYPRLVMEVYESLDGNQPLRCLPHLLGDLGYRTAFMKTALGLFEDFPGLISNLGFELGAFREQLERPPFERTGYLGLDELAMLGPALGWAREEADQPFFLTLLTVTPHHPYDTPGQAQHPRPSEHSFDDYQRALAYQDHFLGLVFEQFVGSGLLDDGLFIVLGDHGEAFGEHVRFEHDAVPWQEAVHVPWLLYGPEFLGPPRRISGLRSQIDLVPTIFDLLGVESDGRTQGKSLLGPPHGRVWSSCWYTDFCVAFREGDTKAIYHFDRQPTEVFRLSSDPLEKNNLALAMPRDEVVEIERQALTWKASIDLFYAGHPLQQGIAPPSQLVLSGQ